MRAVVNAVNVAFGALLVGVGAAIGVVIEQSDSVSESDYCAEYQRQTGTPTRFAAGACWIGTDGTAGPFYPLDPEAGIGR